ncbi:unnamed protein product [Trichogramma brassicae]|uniref:Uncharacterized protein n=1 Tax=Trichogramma brassicae TaxID=86971 RepID=A0A6H5IKS0_9HYME|nr:unnamed protein product [Trichogramma brassicae]
MFRCEICNKRGHEASTCNSVNDSLRKASPDSNQQRDSSNTGGSNTLNIACPAQSSRAGHDDKKRTRWVPTLNCIGARKILRTRRYKKTKNAEDKEKFNDESSSDSLHLDAKFEVIEKISNDGNSDVDADGDVSMLPLPERTAKARAREKIAEIVNAGKRHRKPTVLLRVPVIQVENSDLQRTERQSACGNDLISFQENLCESPPASASTQSQVNENNNSQPNAVPESILDSNKQEYVRCSFPEIAQEIFDKLPVGLRKNPVPNRRELQKDIWEVRSDKEHSQKVCEKAPEWGTSVSDIGISQDSGQPNGNNIIPARNFDTLADERESWNRPRTRSSQHCDAKIVESPEQYRCAEMMPSVPLTNPTHSSIPREARLGPRTVNSTCNTHQDSFAQHGKLDYEERANDDTRLPTPSNEYNNDDTSTSVKPSIIHFLYRLAPPRESADTRDHNTSRRDAGSSVLQNADVTHAADEAEDVQQCYDNAALCKYYVAKSRPTRSTPPWYDHGLNGH